MGLPRQFCLMAIGVILEAGPVCAAAPVESGKDVPGGFTIDPTPPPPGVLVALQPDFPVDVRASGHTDGHAVVAVTIDEAGRVTDGVTLEASHPAFAASAEMAVAEWLFVPLPAPTRPRRELLQFEYRSDGVVTTLTHAEASRQELSPPVRENALRTLQWSQLATPPERLDAPMPALSRVALGRLAGKPVIVSFVIDTQGVVHVPVVPAGTDKEAADAVLQAVRGWRYAPPRQQGEPVLVQVNRAIGDTGSNR
jgi:TonB family protein